MIYTFKKNLKVFWKYQNDKPGGWVTSGRGLDGLNSPSAILNWEAEHVTDTLGARR